MAVMVVAVAIDKPILLVAAQLNRYLVGSGLGLAESQTKAPKLSKLGAFVFRGQIAGAGGSLYHFGLGVRAAKFAQFSRWDRHFGAVQRGDQFQSEQWPDAFDLAAVDPNGR